MPAPDPKQNTTQSPGGATPGAYPLDRYTAAPKQEEGGGDQSPFYKSSAPTISLPKGGGALKGIDEKFTVNAVNGTAALQVPLPLTPGRSGFTPGLSLQYNSGSGNGEFGLGWNLSLPAITRKTDKKLPQYDDANESDVFLMAGAEDLQPLLIFNTLTLGWDADVQHGIAEAGHTYTIKRYRPRIEGLFALIEFVRRESTADSWWKVTTKDNVVTFYGLSSSARVSDPKDAGRIFKWLPELSFDNKGNVQQYFYTTENTPSLAPAGMHERNRANGLAPFTQVYLQRVKYCNLTPYNPSGHTYDYSSVLPSFTDFLMEAVLDYGNYDPIAPTPNPSTSLTLPTRIDPFSDFHAGFEIRTYRKCMRVLMFHYFTELNSGAPVLVRSLDFIYNSTGGTATYAEADFITSIVQSGYVLQSGAYVKKSLPALDITYAPLQWDNEVHNVSPQDAENAPQGLTGYYQWIDLWGEGLPGILSEQAGGWFYKSNLGNGHFEPALSVASKPSFQGLGSNMQWQDLDADGHRQLVSRDGTAPGYFELNDDQQWQPFRTFPEWINIDWNSPYTRVLDLNGDGKPDVLLTEETAWKWYENTGTGGYTEGGYSPVFFDEEQGPRLLLNDMVQAIFLADMNGDGMTDIVRIQNGEVCYWPNIGYGKFGAKVTMTNAPWFDTADIFNPQYLTLADISGTGAADIIYIGQNSLRAWVNLAGNAWSAVTDIAPVPGVEAYSKITVADFLGSGTSCIVWSSPLPQHAWAPMRYIDLMGGSKPYLMTEYKNNMGKAVSLTYQHSTQFYLDDKQAGTEWATRLPFPVHCVSRIETSDIAKDPSTGVETIQTTYTQQYSYHHGYYDHEEREFRGFGRVDTVDTDAAMVFDSATSSPPADELDQAPVKTKTWYHTGAWLREQTLLDAFSHEYYSLPGRPELPTTPELFPVSAMTVLTPQDEREAYRTLKGQPLRQEVYALDGLSDKPYTVTSYAYAVQQVQPVTGNRYGALFSYKRQSLSYTCERNINDPRILHELTLSVDQYGNVLNAAKVCYPRVGIPSPPVPSVVATVQAAQLITYTVTDYTSDATTGGYHLRLPYQARTYELTGVTPLSTLYTCAELLTDISGATLIDFSATPGSGVHGRLLAHTRTLYLANDATTVLPPATIDTLGLSYRQYHLAFTNGILTGSAWYNGLVTGSMLTGTGDGGYVAETSIPGYSGGTATNYWLPGGTMTYDTTHFYTPTAFSDPWGNTTTITYWNSVSPPGTPDYYLLPQSVTDAKGNVTTVNEYNWYNLQPTHITDANNNEGKILFDALGMPVAAAMMEKNGSTTGDTLSGIDPANSTDLANQAAFFTDPSTYAASLLQGATWRCVYDLSVYPIAVGMIGREQHHLPTVSPPDNTLLIRLTYTDGLGRVAMHKVQAAPDESTPTIPRWIGSGKTIYNNKGKAVMQYEPYFSATALYDTAEQAATQGVSPRMHYDPLGRVIRTDMPDGSYTTTEWDAWMQVTYDNNDTVLSSDWYTQNAATSAPAEQQDAAAKAAHHDSTPTTIHLDTLARPFYTVQHDRTNDTATPWSDSFYESYVVLDILGNRMEVHDARGITCLTYSYNMLKGVAQQNSVDSGVQYMLTDAANQPLYAWDADSRKFHFTYDVLRRQVQKQMTPSGGSVHVLQKITYGEGVTGALTNNLNGRPYETYDGVGYKKVVSYDFKGNPLQINEQLLTDYTIADVDWNASPALNTAETFTTQTTYDALSRPVSITDPGSNVTTHVYDLGGNLFSVTLTPSGGSPAAYVTGIYYNSKGQRQTIYYGNGTKTVYTYNAVTYRLTRLLTTAGSGGSLTTYQDLNYWYDPVGNITKIKDASQRALYFSNSVTLPEADYTYDALYRLVRATGREQIGTATFGSTDNYNDSAWMGISQPGNDLNTQNYTQQYDYDAVGNVTSLQHMAGSGSYTRSYSYIAGSNRLSKTTVGATNYPLSYDNRGNINAMPHLSSITFNANNEMSIANLGGGGTSYYQYSGGQRGRKAIVNGANLSERIYLGNYEIYRTFVSGSLTLERTTVHVSDDTGRIAMLEVRTVGTDPSPASLTRYIYSNHLSTATLELNAPLSGLPQIISYEEYHPYGTTSYQARNTTINAVAKRYRYTNKERDDETGLYYIGARYYAPWLTRWCAADPINNEWYNFTHGEPGRNLERQNVDLTCSSYEYCYANPIRFIDPTGQQPKNSLLDKTQQAMYPTFDVLKPQNTRTPQTQPDAWWMHGKMGSELDGSEAYYYHDFGGWYPSGVSPIYNKSEMNKYGLFTAHQADSLDKDFNYKMSLVKNDIARQEAAKAYAHFQILQNPGGMILVTANETIVKPGSQILQQFDKGEYAAAGGSLAMMFFPIGRIEGAAGALLYNIRRMATFGETRAALQGIHAFEEVMSAGRAFVGKGAVEIYAPESGKFIGWESKDGLRRFRPPSYKQEFGIQANFEQRTSTEYRWGKVSTEQWRSNVHVQTTDVFDYSSMKKK